MILLAALSLWACDNKNAASGSDAEKAASDGKSMTLSISIRQPSQGPVVLMKPQGREMRAIDTIAANATAKLEKKISTPEHGIYILNIANRQYVNLVITGEDLQVEAEGSNMAAYSNVTGSLEMQRFNEAIQLNRDFQSSMMEMQQQMATAIGQGQSDQARQLQNTYMQMASSYQQDMQQLILSWGVSISGAYFAQSLLQQADYEFLDAMATIWKGKSEPYPAPVYDIINKASSLAKTRIGVEAPAIEEASPSGEMIALSSLRGKYVLIDFWASWCQPCRQENPNTREAYAKYKDRGFEVYAVSLDQEKEKWLKAIAQDQLEWVQVSDLKGYNSVPAQNYGINAIPATFLLDTEGKIIAKDLRGYALEQKLQEVFGRP